MIHSQRFHPELIRLLESGETLEQFNKLQAEQILLRWFNYHLKWAGWQRTVTNFSSDVRDGKNYTVLLNQLSASCSMAPLQTVDQLTRAEMVLQNADLLHCRKYLTAKTMLSGSSKLNLAFVANLFNKCPGLDPLSELEKSAIDNWLFGSEGDREARGTHNFYWMIYSQPSHCGLTVLELSHSSTTCMIALQ